MILTDSIEKIIGKFGRYHIFVLILILLGRVPTEVQLINVVFILPTVDYICLDEGAFNATNYCPCKYPEYDQSTIVSSVTTTWNLICDRKQLASLTQSMLQIGILVGSLLYGYISDRYGRKIAVLLSLLTEVIFVAISAAVTELWMFMACRFLIGTAVGGTMLCCYVILIEMSGKSFRPYLSGLIEITYITSYVTLPIIAYYLRHWRHLQIATSLPWLFVVFFFWLIPESPRWLITIGLKQEAIDTLRYIAKKNKRPTEYIEPLFIKLEQQNTRENEQRYNSYLDLFKTKKMTVYTLIMSFIWTCCAHTFFGVNQYIGRLQGNLYLNVMLSGLSHIPGLIMVVLASLYLKRKISVIISFLMTAISLLIFIFIPSIMTNVRLAVAIIGLIGAYTAFVTVYLYCSEIFPTVIRNSAMGFASVFARFGAFIAPFVVNIGIEWVSITIFSTLAFCAAFLCLFLPETKDTVLLNTVAETERSRDKNQF